jgi:Kef-type K+ transport system membrane component KefB
MTAEHLAWTGALPGPEADSGRGVVTHSGIPAADASVLWAEVAVLLSLAWLLGSLARRLGQPPIVGSLVAGLVAGPSVFGEIWPAGFRWFRPGTPLDAGLLSAVAEFALLILLIALGAETDLPLIRRLGRPAGGVVGGSLVLPLAAGAAVAIVLPRSLIGPHGSRTTFVLLVAAAMAVSSLPVIARTLTEMGITRRNVGQLSIAAATVNDGVGFVVLALATALTGSGGTPQLIKAVVGLVALVVVLATVGQRVVDTALRRSRRHGPDVAGGLAVTVVVTFIVAAVAQAVGVDAALGAFLAGIVIGRSRYAATRVLDTVAWASDAVFAPLYFATAGLSVDISQLGHGSTGLWFVVVLAVALAAKLAGVYSGARLTRVPRQEALGLGVALNGRGALQVILATAGLTTGILTSATFTIIILLSIVSSVAVPPVLRRVLRDWRGTSEERERLEHEAEMASNVIVRGQRLLLPSRGSANSAAAARIIDLAWPAASEVTLLHVADDRRDDRGIEHVRQALVNRRMRECPADGTDVVGAILAEANLGYGAIAVGAADEPTSDRLLPEFIEDLLKQSPIPLLVVRRGATSLGSDGRPRIRPRRILVPVTGNAASQAGQELAQMVSLNTGADLTLLHVVTRPDVVDSPAARRPGSAATAVVEQARQSAAGKSLDPQVAIKDAASSGEEIERESARIEADLVVVGTTVRRVADRPFLGHTVEHLLQHVIEPTVVVVVLPDAQQAVADEHIDRRAG